MTIDYNIAKNKALSLKRQGFGPNIGAICFNQERLESVDLPELTQIVAISYYRAKEEFKNFYSVLYDELSQIGLFQNRSGIEVIDFNDECCRDKRQMRQLWNLYHALGFDLFYKSLAIDTPRSTVQKWTMRCFAKRKNESRVSKKQRGYLKKILTTGGIIRFSNTSSSVYIKHNEGKIRISDHPTNDPQYTINIIIDKF